ncbi:MAG: hypothetical protein IJ680_03840 [Paludibacteraceae bacterium]|nr:hypothetical protein [Paludibacteraceae bacterium]
MKHRSERQDIPAKEQTDSMTDKSQSRFWYNLAFYGGWLLIALAVLIVAGGVFMWVDGDRSFYQRQADYHAQDDARNELNARIDSLYALATDLQEAGDSIEADRIQTEIWSIMETDEYAELLGVPEPPRGFSLAGIASLFVFMLAIVPLGIGIALLVVGYNGRHKQV